MLLMLVFSGMNPAKSQTSTRLRGHVLDAKTKEPLPFVNVFFVGKNIGTITDYDGAYEIETQWATGQVEASYLGYFSQIKGVSPGKNQDVDFYLESKNYDLQEVEITSKRKRYKNKNNPAVDLIRKVIENKKANRLESNDFYEFDKYEKVEFDLNNITQEFQEKKAFKKFQFIFDYVDTSKVNGKPYLPVFLQETLSKVYYRQSPKSKKEHVSGTNMVGFHEYIDNDGVSYMLDHLYQDIDLYNNNIDLLTNQFVSPISSIAPSIYKFHIIDTLDVDGFECIELAFQPRNKADFAFKGSLFITNDGNYSLKKAKMKVSEDINLNFVTDLQIEQVFEKVNNESWILTKDQLIVDFNIGKKGIGMYGKRTVDTKNYVFNQEREEDKYEGVQSTIMALDHKDKSQEYWNENRLVNLSEQEKNVYVMVDSVQNIPAFKRTMDVVMLLVAGYWNFGYVDMGPVNTFYSWNEIEGFRLRVGGRTSEKFSKKFRLDGYLMYGFKDERYKYSFSATQSLNKRSLRERPQHSISAMYQRATNFPGMEMMFINEDNLLLSFKRGKADKIIYYDMFKVEHKKDWRNGFSSTFILKNIEQEPGGTLEFNYEDYSLDHITSSEITGIIRFAPNETFYDGMDYRTPILSKYPIMQFTFTQGFKGVLNGDYKYSKLKLNLFKRFYLSPIGFTNFEIEAGKIFGTVPFPLMFVHRANQTYSYQLRSYNLMNFLEFVSDEYVSLFVEHHFNGFIFNKLPLIKHLKFRSIVSFKGIYGNVTDENDPNITSGLMQFPIDAYGNPTTFTLDEDPYMEVSVGIGNIFKVFRVDLIKRLTYLDNPSVSDIGIRARFKFEF